MRRRELIRFALPAALISMGLAVTGFAEPAGAVHEDCSDDPLGGAVIQQGTPTTNPPSSYVLTTTGLELTVGPIAGVGTVAIKVSTAEVSVFLQNPLGSSSWTGAGVDPTPGTTVFDNDFELAACFGATPLSRNVYVDIDDPDPARLGLTVRLFTCVPGSPITCSTLLGHTGLEADLGVLANTCVWLDGRQQNLLATCPAVDAGSGLQL